MDNITKAKRLNWNEYHNTLPLEGVVYPKGQSRADIIARMRNAFRRDRT